MRIGQFATRVARLVERHERPIAAAQWLCFAVTCAAYAGFIRLPRIVTAPAMVGVVLTAARYAVWEGWLKNRVLGAGRSDERGPG